MVFQKGNKFRFKKGHTLGFKKGHTLGFKKGHIPWNMGVKGKEYLKHCKEGKAWNKGKKESKEHREKIREGNTGKKHLEETKRKIREWNLGKHFSEETREKLRIARLKQRLPLKDTKIEVALQEALKKYGIEFETHKNILDLTQPDIFIEPNICIFVDGCYWHGCEQCFDKNAFDGNGRINTKIRHRKVNDILITQQLINNGYVVLRFWEHEINKNVNACIGVILS